MDMHDIYTMAVVLDKREKVLNQSLPKLQRLIEEVALSSDEDLMEKLSRAVGFLRLLQSRWKGLRTVVTGEDTPLGDVALPPLNIVEH